MNDLDRTTDSGLEKIRAEKKKWTDRQKEYNISSKNLVQIIGSNLTLFVCLLLPFLLIGFIWTDFGAPVLDIRLMSDGIVTVAMFVIGEILMIQIGTTGGKLDEEYVNARKEFDRLVKAAHDAGTMFMSVFCEWQIDNEIKQATATRLRYLRLTKEEWNKVKDMPYHRLIQKFGFKKAEKIMELNRLEPVELNESILLFNNADALSRGGVPLSGEEFIYKKTHSVGMYTKAVFAALITVSVAITLTSDISFSRVMYTAFKLIVLLYRMAQGYDIGAKAYNTVEVKQLQAKNNYIQQYLKFIENKIYLKLGNKYGDIECYLSEEDKLNNERDIP
ncbi:MAG: hypothetical protein IKW46_08205 [Bacteroidaceae bacterium]|nr:hypothetical protein [Bacteroidaceae bacterium]